MADMRAAIADIDETMVFVIPPPVIQGIGSGGFRMMIQDRGSSGYGAMQGAAYQFMGQAAQTPALANVFTLFNSSTPRVYADVDRTKADMLGVPSARVFEALQVYLGSAYVNDFNLLGRTYRVTAQADSRFRDDTADIASSRPLNHGAMVPTVDRHFRTARSLRGPYNLFPRSRWPASPPRQVAGRRWRAEQIRSLPSLRTGGPISLPQKAAGNRCNRVSGSRWFRVPVLGRSSVWHGRCG